MASAPNLLQAIRAHYGIRLGVLANCLGVSEPLMALAATNRRELPTAALLRLEPLGRALPPPWNAGAPPPPLPPPAPLLPPAPPLPDPPAPAALRTRLVVAEAAALRMARALATAERPAAQARRLLAVLPAFAAGVPPADERAHRLLPYLEAEARAHLGPLPAGTRALLGARLGALHLEIAWLGEWLRASEP